MKRVCETVRITAFQSDIIASNFKNLSLRNWEDTVGQPPSTEIGVLNMPSVKAKKLRELPQGKVLLEL
jgi:hypothetical protein